MKIVFIYIIILSALISCDAQDSTQISAQDCAENFINEVAAESGANVISVKATNTRKVPGKDIIIHDIESELFDNKNNKVINIPKKNFQCYTSDESYKEYEKNKKRLIYEKIYTWKTDYYQSALENNNVTASFFKSNGEGFPKFMVPSKTCKVSREQKNINIVLNNLKLEYKYFCIDAGSPEQKLISPKIIVYLGKNFTEIAFTINAFEVAEGLGSDVKVKILDKIYTFDAAGFRLANKKMTEYYRSK